jgi:hypothetical protein
MNHQEKILRCQSIIDNQRTPLNAFEDTNLLAFCDAYLKNRRGAPFSIPRPGDAIVVSFSGGIDSTITLGYLLELGFEVFPYYVLGADGERRELESIKFLSRWFREKYKPNFRWPVFFEPNDPILRLPRLRYRYILHMPVMMILGLQYASLLSDRLLRNITTVVHSFTADDAKIAGSPATLTMQRLLTVLADFGPDPLREKMHLQPLSWQQTAFPMEREWGCYLEKAALIRIGTELGLPLEHTRSCSQPAKTHCGTCYPCKRRKEAWAKTPSKDPARYQV